MTQPLERRQSKSRLIKQGSVENEEPPPLPTRPTTTTQQHVRILEHRVESLDLDDHGKPIAPASPKKPPPGAVLRKASAPASGSSTPRMTRSHALCGDDDTRLSAPRTSKETPVNTISTGSAGSSLSRGASDSSASSYTDSTGVNLEEFIVATLHKNAKDRRTLCEIETQMNDFVDTAETLHRFPAMSSYNRMLVHRVAAFYGLDHNVDQTGQAVVVNKSDKTRKPENPFSSYIRHDNFTDDLHRRTTMLTQRTGGAQPGSLEARLPQPTGVDLADIRKSRSYEERAQDQSSYAFPPSQGLPPPTASYRSRGCHQQDSSSSAEGLIESPVSGYSSESVHGGLQYYAQQRLLNPNGAEGGIDGAGTVAGTSQMGFYIQQPTLCIPPVLPQVVGPQAQSVVIFAVGSVDQVPQGAPVIDPCTGTFLLNPDGTVYQHNVSAPQPLVQMFAQQQPSPTPPQQIYLLQDQQSPVASPVPPYYTQTPIVVQQAPPADHGATVPDTTTHAQQQPQQQQ